MPTKPERSVTLNCFSPPVILATFLIETVLAAYILIRYRRTRYGKLAAILIALLALFQLSEFLICRGASPDVWARIGFIATVFLPVLAIDFLATYTQKRSLVPLWYAVAAAFVVMIGFSPGLFGDVQCTGRFVVFDQAEIFDFGYATYYLAALFFGIGQCVTEWKRFRDHRVLGWMLVAYASFMLPTFALYAFIVATRRGAGSILCGFALLMALILCAKVVPIAARAGKKPRA